MEAHDASMERNILFRCPRTGMNVQHRLPDLADVASNVGNSHVSVTCLACGSMHFLNSATGKLLSEKSRVPAAKKSVAVEDGDGHSSGLERTAPR